MSTKLITPDLTEGTNVDFRIDSDAENVVVDFGGVKLSHMCIPPEAAEAFAHLLLKHAQSSRMKKAGWTPGVPS